MRARISWILLVGCVSLILDQSIALAHEGPPFAVLMDQPAAGYNVSVWADPDIGEARFFIIVETPEGKMPERVPQVDFWVEPTSGRLARADWETTRQSLRKQLQFDVEPYFDQRDMWNVGVRLARPDGTSEELVFTVESTPPGFGVWDLAIYLFPFLLIGGLWMVALARRRRAWREHALRETLK